MERMSKEKAEEIIEIVAKNNHITAEEVKQEIKLAMLAGMSSQDPAKQQKWQKVPHDGDDLTLEELLIYLSLLMQDAREE